MNDFLDCLYAKKAQITIPREGRIKAVFRWSYMHSAESLSLSEILSYMTTDKSIAALYPRINKLK